jgi:hypothetical protein
MELRIVTRKCDVLRCRRNNSHAAVVMSRLCNHEILDCSIAKFVARLIELLTTTTSGVARQLHLALLQRVEPRPREATFCPLSKTRSRFCSASHIDAKRSV